MPFRSLLIPCRAATLAVLVILLGSGCDDGGGLEFGPGLPAPELDGIEIDEVSFDNALGDRIGAAYLVPPGSTPMPAVVVLHGAGGLYDEDADEGVREFERQFEEWAALLYQEGYAVLMPASFYSRGFYEWNDHPSGLDKEDRLVMRVHDAYAALEFACRQPEIDCDRVAVMGFSNGGSVAAMSMHDQLHEVERMTSLSADRPRFALSIPYYPGCGWKGMISLNLDEPDEFYFPYASVYVQHAEEDSLLDDCELRLAQTDMLTDLTGYSRNPFELTVHDNAGHGFDSSPNGSSEERARDRGRLTTLDLLASEL